MDLALGKGLGTALQEQLQKLKGLGREVNGLAAEGELPRLGVEHALPESNPHQRSRKNPGTFQCFSNDIPTSRRHLDYHAGRETMKNAPHNRIRPLLPLLILAGLASPASTVSAGVGVWTSGGPYGGDIRALAIDPANPATLYAGTTGGGVFKSTDGGGSWAAVNTGLTSVPSYALAIDPTTPATLYAGGTEGGGVFKSTDSGGTWAAANAGLTERYVRALAINPSDPRHALRRGRAAGSSSPPTPAAPGPPPTRD